MHHYWSLEEVYFQNAWLTIGQFDGVHLGHQQIIRRLIEGAHTHQSPAVVITFFPHPAVVLGKRISPSYLTTPDERANLLGELGVDAVITHPFDKNVAATSAQDFMTNIKTKLGIERLIVGHDFAMGHNRTGNVPKLKLIGHQLGFAVEEVPPVTINGELVSSSLIRKDLSSGSVEKAALLLGRNYRVSGEVIPGDGRGRTIGIPTANLNMWQWRALPASGVYVCQAYLMGKTWGAVTNIGTRPTFAPHSNHTWVETHLLDFDEQIYGQELRLSFIARLRGERRFPNIQALIDQINHDISKAKTILTEYQPS
jgi:riboflavin kinase/FMN adenylyltransferase